jgi:alpha-galactosidase
MQPLPKKIMLEVIQPCILSMEWSLEAYLTGDRRMLLDGALMLSTYQSSGRPKSYQQVVDFMEEYFSLPFNREMAEHFK